MGWRDLDNLDALGAQCEGLMLARAAGSVVAITRASGSLRRLKGRCTRQDAE